MRATFRKTFVKDLERYAKDKDLLAKVKEIILQVEAADSVAAMQLRLKAMATRHMN